MSATMKYVTRLTGHLELYNLTSDKDEKMNLFDTDMKVNYEALEADRALRKWFSYYEDPLVSGWTKPVTGTGQRRALYFNASGWPNTPEFDPV